jgi:hypothetical protein
MSSEIKADKWSPATGTSATLGDSGDTFTLPSGATIVNSGTATGFGITQANFLPNAQPIIINGDMQLSQRSTSVTGKTTSDYYTVDRMKNVMSGLGTWTIAQETLTSGNAFAAGFNKAFRMDCTTADASPAAGATQIFTTYLEGQDVQCFKKGTANAETYTLAFWVKSNKTGTGQVNLVDNDNSRMCGASYTISSGDTWEHKVLNYAADTTGSFGNDNGRSLKIEWWLDSGSNHSSGTMPTAWEAESATDENAAGTLSLADNTANDWAITGIQLEVGTFTSSTLPPFQFESFAANELRCMRYYQTFGRGFIGKSQSASTGTMVMTFPVPMRDTPSCTVVTGSDVIADPGVAAYEITSITGNSSGPLGLYLAINTNGGGSGNFYLGTVNKVGDAESEL